MLFFEGRLGLRLERLQLRPEFLLGLFVHAINEQDSVEVVAFVLDRAGKEAGASEFDRFAVSIQRVNLDRVRPGESVTPRRSRTVTSSAKPTCCAARPIPLCAYMVSNMSAMSFLIEGVTASTRAPFWRKTGVPNLTTARITVALYSGHAPSIATRSSMAGLRPVRT